MMPDFRPADTIANPAREKNFVLMAHQSPYKRLNKSVYKEDRNVHIEYLHGITLCDATALLSIRLAVPAWPFLRPLS